MSVLGRAAALDPFLDVAGLGPGLGASINSFLGTASQQTQDFNATTFGVFSKPQPPSLDGRFRNRTVAFA